MAVSDHHISGCVWLELFAWTGPSLSFNETHRTPRDGHPIMNH